MKQQGKHDTITITEKKDSIEIILDMKSIIPCVNAIKQYNSSFKAKDVLNDHKFFKGSLIETINEYYNDVLYGEIAGERNEE